MPTNGYAGHGLPAPLTVRARQASRNSDERLLSTEQAARVALEVANRLKTEFAQNLGREVKSPLETIASLSRLLGGHAERRLDDVDIVGYARLIDDAARSLMSFLAGILDLANLEGGECPLNRRELRLDGVLEAVLAAHEAVAEKAGVSFLWRIPGELPVVEGDASKLYQVFTHILAHAIETSGRGAVVMIEAGATAHGVAVFVRDSGNGTSAEDIAAAMRPLGYLDSSRTRWRESKTLKLRLAKAVVELHGGKLTIASVGDRGTEVAVMLPPAVRTLPWRGGGVANRARMVA